MRKYTNYYDEYQRRNELSPEERKAIERTLKGPPKRKMYSRKEKEFIGKTLREEKNEERKK